MPTRIIGCPSHISIHNIGEIEIQKIPGFLSRLLTEYKTKIFFDPADTTMGYVRDVVIDAKSCVLCYDTSTNIVVEVYYI